MRTVILSGIVDPEDVRKAKNRAYNREWYRKNPEKAKAKRLKHAESQKQLFKRWLETHKEHRRQYFKDYYAKNPKRRHYINSQYWKKKGVERPVPQVRVNWLDLTKKPCVVEEGFKPLERSPIVNLDTQPKVFLPPRTTEEMRKYLCIS